MFLFIGCDDDDNSTEPTTKMSSSFEVTIENVSSEYSLSSSGVFNTPVGASSPAPVGPGGAYEFSFSAAPGSKLSFATMFVHSNDLFFAPSEMGIELFDDMGNQMLGDVTSYVYLWDAGSEVNQEPGLGADQAPRQSGPDTGEEDSNMNVRMADDDFNNLPAVSDVISVTLSSTSATGFTLRIENVSDEGTLTMSDNSTAAVPIAPGVWVVHSSDSPLFEDGSPDMNEGLEHLAEDGNPVMLADYLESQSGITQMLAPGVWAVHSSSNVLFTANSMDSGDGLEALAEDGDPSGLAGAVASEAGVMSSGVFNTPVGSSGPGPLTPGHSYSFMFEAEEGEYLSFATMFVQSNDLFYAPDGMGIALYSGGMPRTGDITSELMLWDAGTEVNEEPGFGLYQAPRQSGANMGMTENGDVQLVDDGYSYPANGMVLRVTISTL